jgi:hypothetical protein
MIAFSLINTSSKKKKKPVHKIRIVNFLKGSARGGREFVISLLLSSQPIQHFDTDDKNREKN